MILYIRQLSIILTLIAVATAAYGRGPESGGGGGVIKLNDNYHVVDFYNVEFALNFLESKYSDQSASRIQSPSVYQLNTTNGLNGDPAFMIANQVLQSWSQLPYDLIGSWIKVALFAPIEWSIVDVSLPDGTFFRPPLLPANAKVTSAVYYEMHQRIYQVKINRTIWNHMKLQDQVGILIHEALRHIQIAYTMRFDDESLQKATTIMMVCKPRIKRSQYLIYLLQNPDNQPVRAFDTFENLTKDCHEK